MRLFHAAQRLAPSLVAPPAAPNDPTLDAQQLWFATQRREWSSLVVIPAEPGCATLPVAVALADVSRRHRGRGLLVVPAEKLDLTTSAAVLAQLHARGPQDGTRDAVVVALGAFSHYPAGIPVARAADAAILCVEAGRTHVAAARQVLELVGRERFLGYVLVGRKGRR